MIQIKILDSKSFLVPYKENQPKLPNNVDYEKIKQDGMPNDVIDELKKYIDKVSFVPSTWWQSLESVVNEWLKRNNAYKIIDIKYQSSDTTDYSYERAMITFETNGGN